MFDNASDSRPQDYQNNEYSRFNVFITFSHFNHSDSAEKFCESPAVFSSRLQASVPNEQVRTLESDSHRTLIRLSSDSYQTLIRLSSDSHQTLITLSLDSHQTLIRLSSDSHQSLIRLSSDYHHTLIKISSDSQTHCNLPSLITEAEQPSSSSSNHRHKINIAITPHVQE